MLTFQNGGPKCLIFQQINAFTYSKLIQCSIEQNRDKYTLTAAFRDRNSDIMIVHFTNGSRDVKLEDTVCNSMNSYLLNIREEIRCFI